MENDQKSKEELDKITEKVIGCAYAVHNELGSGFLEKVYENALLLELRQAGLAVQQQYPVDVHYKGRIVGQFNADLLVDNEVIVELKAVKHIVDSHMAQGMNYLKATRLRICLLLNFGGRKVQVKRVVRGY